MGAVAQTDPYRVKYTSSAVFRGRAVELLVNKARLEPDVALAFAEAIDMAISNAQLVTVPVLDTRFAAVDAKIEKCKADLVRWVFLVMLGNVALSAGATAVLNFLQRTH